MSESAKKPPAHDVILDRLNGFVEQVSDQTNEGHRRAFQELCLVLAEMDIPAAARKKVLIELQEIAGRFDDVTRASPEVCLPILDAYRAVLEIV